MKQIPFSAEQFLQGHFQRIDNIGYHPQKIMIYAGCFPKQFSELFGKSSFVYTTYKPMYYWAFEFEGAIFVIVSANERGTTVESNTNDHELVEDFLDELIGKLKTLDDKNVNFWVDVVDRINKKK